jgi:hypothetical protein
MMLEFLGHKEAHDAILRPSKRCCAPKRSTAHPDIGGKASTTDLGKAIARPKRSEKALRETPLKSRAPLFCMASCRIDTLQTSGCNPRWQCAAEASGLPSSRVARHFAARSQLTKADQLFSSTRGPCEQDRTD